MNKSKSKSFYFVLIVVAVCLTAAAAVIIALSISHRDLVDIHDENGLEQFAREWAASNADELKYGAACIDIENCEINILAVTEEQPYAALYFNVTSTVETEGTGYMDCLALFEERSSGGLYDCIARSSNTGREMRAFSGTGLLTPGLQDWVYIFAGNSTDTGASAYSFNYNGTDYTKDIPDSGYVLDITVLPYGSSTEITDRYVLDASGNVLERYW